MAMLSFCGIDVSKDRLDVMVLPEQQCSSVGNNVAGWSELIERLRGFSIAVIGLEASGGYERGVMRALLAAGMSVRQINPFKLRQFAKASGVLAKNDRLDARTQPSGGRRRLNGWRRWSPSGASSATRRSPPRTPPECWKMRCCSVFLVAASRVLLRTSP